MSLTLADVFVKIASDDSQLKSGLKSAESQTQSWAGKLGGIVQGGLGFATGTLIVGGIKAIGSSIMGLGATAVEAYAKNEQLGLSLESMLAKEMKNASGVEKSIVVGQQKIELTKKEMTELGKLTNGLDDEIFKRDQLSQKLQIAQAELAKMEGAEKRNETAIANKRLAIENLQHSYDGINTKIGEHQSRITELTSKQSQLVDVTQTVKEGQMTLGEAMEKVTGPAKTLQYWIEKLAIQSPFESEGISKSYQLALNFGFATNYAKGFAIGLDGVKQAQEENIITSDRLISSLVDWGAGSGKTTAEIENSTRALGQMRMTGKVTKEDLNQLTTSGLDWMTVLKGMGYTLDDVSGGAVSADDFILKLTQSLEADFAGAAAKSGSSVQGLLTSLTELKTIGLRELFAGSIQAIQPYIAGFVDMLSNPENLAGIRAMGDMVGNWLGGQMANLASFIQSTAAPALKSFGEAVWGLVDIFILSKEPLGDWSSWWEVLANLFGRSVADFITTPLMDWIFGLREGFKSIYEIIRLLITGDFRGGIFGLYEDEALIDFLFDLREALYGIAQRVVNEVIPALVAFVGPIIAQVVPGLQLLGQIIMNVAGMVLPLLIQWWNFLIDNINLVLPVLGVVGAAIVAMTSPIALVIGAIMLLATAWANNWGGIQEKTQAVIDFIMPYIQAALAAIQSWWAENGDGILASVSAAWENIKTTVSTVIGVVLQVISTVLASIQSWWQQHGDAIMTIVGGYFTYVQTVVQTVITVVQVIIQTTLAFIQSFWQAHGDTIMTVVNLMWENIKVAFNAAVAIVTAVIEAFSAAIEGDWRGFGEQLRVIWDTAWEAIKTILSNQIAALGTIAKDIVDSIKKFFTETDWLSLGTAIVEGIANGISNGAGLIADAAMSAAKAAYEAAKGFLGISSPSKLMEKGIGANISAGIGEGIYGGINNIQAAMSQALTSLPDLSGLATGINGGQPAASGAGPTVGNISITVSGAGDPAAVGLAVRRELESLFNRAAR